MLTILPFYILRCNIALIDEGRLIYEHTVEVFSSSLQDSDFVLPSALGSGLVPELCGP